MQSAVLRFCCGVLSFLRALFFSSPQFINHILMLSFLSPHDSETFFLSGQKEPECASVIGIELALKNSFLFKCLWIIGVMCKRILTAFVIFC